MKLKCLVYLIFSFGDQSPKSIAKKSVSSKLENRERRSFFKLNWYLQNKQFITSWFTTQTNLT